MWVVERSLQFCFFISQETVCALGATYSRVMSLSRAGHSFQSGLEICRQCLLCTVDNSIFSEWIYFAPVSRNRPPRPRIFRSVIVHRAAGSPSTKCFINYAELRSSLLRSDRRCVSDKICMIKRVNFFPRRGVKIKVTRATPWWEKLQLAEKAGEIYIARVWISDISSRRAVLRKVSLAHVSSQRAFDPLKYFAIRTFLIKSVALTFFSLVCSDI